jgi:hypothetical protein
LPRVLVSLLTERGVPLKPKWRAFLDFFDDLRPSMRTLAELPTQEDLDKIQAFSFAHSDSKSLLLVGVNGAGKSCTTVHCDPAFPQADCSPEFMRTFLRTTWAAYSDSGRSARLDACGITASDDRLLLMGRPEVGDFVAQPGYTEEQEKAAHERKERCRRLFADAMQDARNRRLGGYSHAVVENLFLRIASHKRSVAMGFRGHPDWEFVFLLHLLQPNFQFKVVYLDAELRKAGTMGDIERDMVDIVHLAHRCMPDLFFPTVVNNTEGMLGKKKFIETVRAEAPKWMEYLRA